MIAITRFAFVAAVAAVMTILASSAHAGILQTLYSFTNGSDGSGPIAGLTLVGSTLYGTTSSGGAHNAGTVFDITVPEPSMDVMAALAVFALMALALYRQRIAFQVRRKGLHT